MNTYDKQDEGLDSARVWAVVIAMVFVVLALSYIAMR